jgi:ubiquinone/menaquinone biosynthesis C-methylase UbiE
VSAETDLFDRPMAWRYHAVERLGLRGVDRVAGLAVGAGFPDALEPIRSAIDGRSGIVCDIGSGLGGVSSWLAAGVTARVVAVEPELRAASLGRRAFPELPTIGGSADALPFAAGSAVAVTLVGVLSVVGDMESVLSEAARVVAPGGVVAISDLVSTSSDSVVMPSTGTEVRPPQWIIDGLAARGVAVDEVCATSAKNMSRWAEVATAVEEEIADRHAGTPAYERWRADSDVLGRLLEDSVLRIVTLIATRRDGDAG